MARIKYYNPSTGQWETLTGVQIGYTGPQGATGPAGRSITVKGTLANTGLLPSSGNTAGDAYIISGNLYVWDGTAWNNVGAFQGPSGPTGPTGPQGTTGFTGATGVQGYTGAIGATGSVGAMGAQGATGAQGPMGATGATGEQGSVGPQGDVGPAGTSVLILGTLADESELPSTGNNPGDGYLIDGELWVWSNSGWTNVGNIQGPTGPAGYIGSDGATGPTGASGPAIFVGPDAPSGPSGAMLWFDTDDTDAITLPAGPTGPSGPQGATGATGPASTVPGATGATGAGATGATGAVGPTGPGTTFVRVTVATATGTAAKVGTTTGGSYIPATGDIIAVTYTNGTSVNSATLNVDGSGAKSIYVGGSAATSVANTSASGGTILYYYDGTNYNVLGSQRNSDSDTTYTEISEAEITAGTASTARATSGRREAFVQLGTKAVYAQTSAPSDTNKLWYDTDEGSNGTYGNAQTLQGYGVNATPTASNIPVLNSNAKVPIAAIAPNYVKSSTNHNGTTTRQASTSAFVISGTTISYTTGSTAELLDIWAQVLMMGTVGGAGLQIRANSTAIGRRTYTDTTVWQTHTPHVLFEAAASTAYTFDIYVFATGTTTITNASTDVASGYNPTLEMMSWGRV